MSESLYFIAIIPPHNVQEKIMALKQEVAERFNSKMALKSPGHITLHMPFRWKDKRREELMAMMKKLNDEFVPFEIELNGFGFFEPKVIYIDVEESQSLREIQEAVMQHCKKDLKILNSNYKDKVFRPHITIAFRDLKKPMFYEAQDHFGEKKFHTNFRASQVSLLKHDGKKWEVYS